MSYKCYLFGELMPQTPAKLSVKISGKNTTVTLLNEGEINFLKYPGLTEITLPLVFPMLTASKRPDYYLTLLERAKTQRATTQFIMTRTTPAGQLLFDTNIKVSVEDYTIEESATNGLDVSVEVKLKQYRDYSTKTVAIKTTVTRGSGENNNVSNGNNKIDSKNANTDKKTDQAAAAQSITMQTAAIQTTRPAPSAPKINTYTVKPGDTLWIIAKKCYGRGTECRTIYKANKDRIKNPNRLSAGQVLTIPSARQHGGGGRSFNTTHGGNGRSFGNTHSGGGRSF